MLRALALPVLALALLVSLSGPASGQRRPLPDRVFDRTAPEYAYEGRVEIEGDLPDGTPLEVVVCRWPHRSFPPTHGTRRARPAGDRREAPEGYEEVERVPVAADGTFRAPCPFGPNGPDGPVQVRLYVEGADVAGIPFDHYASPTRAHVALDPVLRGKRLPALTLRLTPKNDTVAALLPSLVGSYVDLRSGFHAPSAYANSEGLGRVAPDLTVRIPRVQPGSWIPRLETRWAHWTELPPLDLGASAHVRVRDETPMEVDVPVGLARRIAGRVVDAGGVPMEGAQVRADFEPLSPWEPSVRLTDADGRFAFGAARPSLVRLRAFHETLGDVTVEGEGLRDFDAAGGGELRLPDHAPTRIRVVFQDGRPAPGVDVRATRVPTLGWWRHERTDEDGNAVLRGFRPGALALEAGVLVDPTAAGGDARGTTSTRATVVLRSGPGETLHACGEVLAADRRATEEPYVCTLLPVPVVRLSVEGLGDDHDGFVRLTVVDAEKGPEVALQRARSPRIRGGMVDHEIRLRSGFRWGEDGPAEPVELLCRKGRYIAVAATARTLDSPLREPDAYRYSLPLLLDATDGDTSGTLVFRPCGRIVGTVVDEVGAPVPNAHIELRPEHRGLLRSTDSDAEGRFRFAGLDAGTYRLAARSDTHVLPPAVDVAVDPADGETPWTIEGSQGGHLRLSGGELRPGVPHELNVIGASGETLTLPRCRRPGNARSLYGPIPAGAWEVFVPRDPDGQRTFGLAPATVVAGQVTVVDVDAVEAPRYRIQGTLDRELPRGTVALLHRGALVSSCALGADDSFTLHSPCAGTHELRIGTSATDYVRIGTLEVEEGETVLPPIEVGRGSIRGSIPPRWKGAIGPVEFHLLGPHGADDDTPLARTRCRRGSFWRLELPDGRYRVLARDAARRIVLETEVEVLDGRVTGTLLHE